MEYISCSHGGSKLQTTWHRDIICLQSIIHSLSHPWVIIGFVRRVTWRVPLVEQEVLTFPEHLSSPLLCNEVCVAQSLVFCGVFCRSLLFCHFIIFVHCHRIVCPYSIYDFWLPLRYLQTFLSSLISWQSTSLWHEKPWTTKLIYIRRFQTSW